MHIRNLFAVAAGLSLTLAAVERASAQNQAPFTIRYPPDNATVREKVVVKVPLASIPEGGYVGYSIDGQFIVALTPTEEQRAAQKAGATFNWVWDTKSPIQVKGMKDKVAPKDGEHEISVSLWAPQAANEGGGSALKETSSVKVRLNNNIVDDPGPLRLRYRFKDGSTSTYNRSGETAIVGGLTQGIGTSDQELVAMKGQLVVGVEDRYENGRAIVRNRLEKLSVRQSGAETTYPAEQLPRSLYQELDPLGVVYYQNETPTFEQFAQLGVPVSTTLDQPTLPTQPVRKGDSWQTEDVPLDLPGTPPDKQPRVTVKSTFEGLEWQNNYPTVKIHQVYDSSTGGFKEKAVTFGTIAIDNPTIKYQRDIYFAYGAGTLVKVVRSLEVSGKTNGNVAPTSGAPGMMMGGMPGGMPGMGGPPPGVMAGMAGMMRGGPGGGMSGGPPPGVMAGMAGMMRGGPGGGASMGGPPSGYAQMMRGMGGGGRRGGTTRAPRGGMMGGGAMGMPPGMMMGGGSGMMMGGGMPRGNVTTGPAGTAITVKSTTTTELNNTGRQVTQR